MIQSKKQLIYDARNGEKQAVIQVEIDSWNVTKEVTTYSVIDYALINDQKVMISQKQVNYDNATINQISHYLESTNDFSGLTKLERDWKKVTLALLIETQSKPLYGSLGIDWELIPE